MPPMPHGDHSLRNGSMAVHQAFLDYAPLFKALNGRVWALRPHAISVREVGGSSSSDLRAQTRVPGSTPISVPSDNEATLSSCQGLPTQLWSNKSLSGGEPGSGGLIQLAGDKQHRCLCVYNPSFSPSQCSTADVNASQIWVYEGPESEPEADDFTSATMFRWRHEHERVDEGTGDCPKHENVLWALQRISESAASSTIALLRSAVPVPNHRGNHDEHSAPSRQLRIKQSGLCLTSNASRLGAGGLGLAPCSGTDPAQHWSVLPAAGGLLQLAQRTATSKQQQCITAPPPPSPPPPPTPLGARPPIVALFEDQQGAQLIVVTSPGSNRPNITQVEITIRGLNYTVAPTATVVRPGELGLTPLRPALRQSGADIVAIVKLQRGAALVRVEAP